MADFDKIQNFLDDMFSTDEKAKTIIKETGLTPAQLKVVNTLIVYGIKAYDSEIHSK